MVEKVEMSSSSVPIQSGTSALCSIMLYVVLSSGYTIPFSLAAPVSVLYWI